MESVLIKTTEDHEFYSDGRIWWEKEQRFLDGWDDDGYNRVTINGITKPRHQWIASMFMKNPENKSELHHIDGNRQNNDIRNLLYVTRSEHMGIHAEDWRIPVYQYTLDGEFVAEWKSVGDAAQCLNVGSEKKTISKNIRACCIGVVKTSYGFQWRYAKYDRIPPVKSRYDRMAESKCKPVEMLSIDGKVIAKYESVKKAAIVNKVKPSSIANNCRGESKTVLINGVKHRFRYKQREPLGSRMTTATLNV